MFRFRYALPIALALVGIAAVGCHRWSTPEQRAEHVKEYVTDELDLTPEQQGKLGDVSTEVLALVKELRDARARDAQALTDALTQPQLDREKLLAAYQERRAAFDQKVPAIVDKLVAFHGSLNNEQKAELAGKLKKHQKRFE